MEKSRFCIYRCMHHSATPCMPIYKASSRKPSQHSPESIQLSCRIPRALHATFYNTCKQHGFTGSDVLRSLMESFVAKAADKVAANG